MIRVSTVCRVITGIVRGAGLIIALGIGLVVVLQIGLVVFAVLIFIVLIAHCIHLLSRVVCEGKGKVIHKKVFRDF